MRSSVEIPDMSGCEAIVVGGGPAGCAAYHALARAGISVVLLESGGRGRDKACGDALVPSAVALLAGLGLPAARLEALGGHRFDAIDLRADRQLIWRLMVEGGGYVMPRAVFDQALRDTCSEGVVYNARVVSVERDGDSWTAAAGLAGTFRASAVVLACGAGPRLSARLGIDGAPLASAAISTYVDTPSAAGVTFDFFDASQPGYGWSFSIGAERVNAGVCRLGASSTSLRRLAQSYLSTMEFAEPLRWRGGGGPCWSGHGRQWHLEDGLVSCGDAAGLIDPISGEGITAALQSGLWAGEAAADYLRSGRRSPVSLRAYSERIRVHFGAQYLFTPFRRVWADLCGLERPDPA